MRAQKTLEIKSAVITLKELHNGKLAIMDMQGNLRKIDTGTYQTVTGLKTNIVQERSWGNHLAISASGSYAACVVPKSNKAVLYSIDDKKLLYTTTRHKGDIESVCIDDNNHYFVTGGTDGKTFVWSLETGKLSYSFPSHADYVTALDISSIWIASASYDKTISVLNLTTMKSPMRLRGHSSVIVQMKLMKQMQMISADKDGNIFLWDLKDMCISHRFEKMNDDITGFALSADEKFLFVGSKLGYVNLYELEKGTLLKRHFLKEESKITSLCVLQKKNQLVIGTKSGLLKFYKLILDEEYLIERLKAKDYAELYRAAEENPLLNYSTVFVKLEALWESTLKKAVKMLELGQRSNAEVILNPFSKVKRKQAKIRQLLDDYKVFQQLKGYVEQKRYSLAYPLVNRHPHFKQSDLYKVMENEWHVKFNKAKAYVLQKDGDEKVRKILENFKGISEKSALIQQLFQQRTAYTLFKKKLAQKDYLSLFALLEKCPFIKEFDEYDKLLEYADGFYIKAQKALDKKEYAKVVSYASELLYFPDLRDDAQKMIDNAKILDKFVHAYDDEDMALMYEMIGKYPFLTEQSEARVLDDDWNYHLVLAEKYASKADVPNATMALEDFFEIKAKFTAIAVVMQQAYISQLQRAMRSKKSRGVIENGIKRYVGIFGIDDHIENFYEKFCKEYQNELDLSRLQKGSISLFRPKMIVPDILQDRR